MILEEDNLHILQELGLTNSQAKVYLALLKLGPDSKATLTSKIAKVPRQDIYRILEELNQVGIVEKLITRPVRFHPIPPKKAISFLLEKKKIAVSKLEKDAGSLSGRLVENLSNQLEPYKKECLVFINERDSVYCKAIELIEDSKKKIRLIIPWSEVMLSLDLALEALNDACNRGVDVKWLADEPHDPHLPEGLRKLISNPRFRFRFSPDPPTVKLGIYDNCETGTVIFHDNASGLSPTLISNNSPIFLMAETYFESYWKRGKDIDL